MAADIPVAVPGMMTLHLLVSHPTPPVFDGPEDRNGRRNAAEIAFWADYLANTLQLGLGLPALIDDQGRYAWFDGQNSFVVLGDLNADPNDGDSRPGAMSWLLDNDYPYLQPIAPTSAGAVEAAERDGGANLTHRSDPAADTADWNDDPERGSGNLRVDYVLPSLGLRVAGCGVFWPTADDPLAYLLDASDHRLVWVDLERE
jgi:endonuclease/exonuclease/phosphatase family metal-dependent hydrolase